MLRVECDHCKKEVAQVAYQFRAIIADNGRLLHGSYHLHWQCIPAWVEAMKAGGEFRPDE